MNKNFSLIMIVPFILGVFWLGTKIDQKLEPVQVPTTEQVEEADDSFLTKKLKPDFMSGCVEGEASIEVYRYCECTFDYLVENTNDEEFFTLISEFEEENSFDGIIYEASAACE